MIGKIRGFLKMKLYTLLYRGRVQFVNIPAMRHGACVKCSNGILHTGRYFSMNSGAYCAVMNGGKLVIGDNVSINRNAIIVCHDSITIGDRCALAPNVLIYDHDHKFGMEGIQPGYNTAPVAIERNCWIGAGVTILRGTHIGEGSVIGAGCVVKGDIPPHSLVTADRGLTIRPITDSRVSRGV